MYQRAVRQRVNLKYVRLSPGLQCAWAQGVHRGMCPKCYNRNTQWNWEETRRGKEWRFGILKFIYQITESKLIGQFGWKFSVQFLASIAVLSCANGALFTEGNEEDNSKVEAKLAAPPTEKRGSTVISTPRVINNPVIVEDMYAHRNAACVPFQSQISARYVGGH